MKNNKYFIPIALFVVGILFFGGFVAQLNSGNFGKSQVAQSIMVPISDNPYTKPSRIESPIVSCALYFVDCVGEASDERAYCLEENPQNPGVCHEKYGDAMNQCIISLSFCLDFGHWPIPERSCGITDC